MFIGGCKHDMSHHQSMFGIAIAVLECFYLPIMSLQLHGTSTFLNCNHICQQELSSEVGSDDGICAKKGSDMTV